MRKTYETPKFELCLFANKDVVTISGLINGGSNGTPERESFSSLFKK